MMNPMISRFAVLMGSASFLTLAAVTRAAGQDVAQAQPETVPEQVLITGSLIHGTAAVGVPVTNLGAQDFTQTGNVTIGDLFRTVPAANVAPGPSAVNSPGQQEREIRVNIRGLDTTGPRSLLMVDGVRFPPQSDGLCSIDPSIIPALALDRVDILADGASATYGSDAIAGVVNVVLKRGFDGAVTLLHYQQPDVAGQEFQASQLFGRTWDGGDITLTYEFINEEHVPGTAHSNYTVNYTPWGLPNQIPIGSSIPGTISVGKPSTSVGANCTNCWAVPTGTGANFNTSLNNGLGPTAPGSAATLNWATLTANAANFGTNESDPLKQGWELAAEQKNTFVATFDQRLFPGISFFATGFDSVRRITNLLTPDYGQGLTNDISTFAVPTTNPYYPTGAPNNLQVSYDFGHEYGTHEAAYEISYRYEAGFNLDLPFSWTGQLYYSRSSEANKYVQFAVNDNAVSVALGSTVGGVTKPAGIPYLNLFCDPRAFQCNSPQTIAYIGGTRYVGDNILLDERGARFDGPLFDLPAGQVKAAVGGSYESDDVVGFTANNETGAAGSPLTPLIDPEPYNVWAGFAQVDIPIFGDNLNLPLVRKLDVEGSFRHDSYNGTLKGSTDNPKVAFTWLIDELVGATVRGSWGTSFRFANAGEYSTVLSDNDMDFNVPGLGPLPLTCAGAAPNPGSAAAALVAAGFACNGPSPPGGLVWGGGPHPQLRNFVNAATGQMESREGGTFLAPEQAVNYSIGFELAPQIDVLRGLDLQATFYSVKINNYLQGFNATSSQTLSDPTQRFHIVLPSDLGCPVSANANPASCAPFEAMAAAALNDRSSQASISALTDIYWINDGSTVNSGYLHVDGFDWSGSYDIDLGDFGAWNTGITGTYYLHKFVETVSGGPVIDTFNQNITPAGGIAQNLVETLPRLIYRARLGWSNGPYSVTGFMNFQSHFFAPYVIPTNVNFQCTVAGGTVGGGTFPCAISNYTSYEPDWITFDLSLGYSTGDIPATTYLKNITIQLTVQDLLNKHSPFEYGATQSGRNISAYDITKPNTGRTIGLTLLKNW